MEFKAFLKPALVGGSAAAIVAAFFNILPALVPQVPALVGLTCCLWMAAGGILSAHLLKKSSGKITLKDGAIAGALAGAVYAVLATILNSALTLAFGHLQLPSTPGLSGETESAVYGIGLALGLVVGFGINLVIGGIICAIGGVMGAVLLEKK